MNIANETIISMTEAARMIPGRPTTATVWRWTTRGVAGIKLESLKIGGRRLTSREAVERFMAACDASDPSHDEAEAELAAEGL